MKTVYRYKSLEDYLISSPLTVDASIDDGWGARFPVKGREINATILFADITAFTRRTSVMSPTETLIFVNNFFSWITAEAIKDTPGIIDKYIGDEVMVIFSEEFGSENPFIDALRCARGMAERDMLSFCPHIGISSGVIIAGFVGTPVKYNVSVFGRPVTIASRCAGVESPEAASSSIVFPSDLWHEDYNLDVIFPPIQYRRPDDSIYHQPHPWKLLDARDVSLKNVGSFKIREIVNQAMHFPQQSAEERAKECFSILKERGFYRQQSK